MPTPAAQEAVQLLPLPPPPSHAEVATAPSYAHAGNNTQITGSQALNLYGSHALSTWNARTYEFAAIIFTASAYPDTLTASALRGITTTTASICFSASIGRWIDGAPNRLRTLLSTITANRLSVIAACLFWVLLVGPGRSDSQEQEGLPFSSGIGLSMQTAISGTFRGGLFAVVLLLGVLEKLSGSANMMSMERDWVVTVAAPDGEVYDLTHLNAVMRRIDLVCKLLAPILLSVLISASESVLIGVVVVGGMSAASWPLEWWCARKVWSGNERLQRLKVSQDTVGNSSIATSLDGVPTRGTERTHKNHLVSRSMQWFLQSTEDLTQYFSSPVWIPSFALSILHLSALSYSATFITYLLNVGFSLNLITIARAFGSVVEISSTIVTPFGVSYLGKAHHHNRRAPEHDEEEDEEDGEEEDSEIALLEAGSQLHGSTETGLERLGLWGITWQLLNLVPVVLTLWALSRDSAPPSPSSSPPSLLLSLIFPRGAGAAAAATEAPPPPPPPTTNRTPASSHLILHALPLFTFLSFSRLGLWIYDLTTQQLTQTLVRPATSLSSFAGIETAFVSLFELAQHVMAAAIARPDQFRYLAVGSWAAVAVSVALYAGWVRRRRGHLVHWEVVGRKGGCAGAGRGAWKRNGGRGG